jgi:hypothetical protein
VWYFIPDINGKPSWLYCSSTCRSAHITALNLIGFTPDELTALARLRSEYVSARR